MALALLYRRVTMSLFDSADFDGHEHVSFFCDTRTGLRAIVAIHSSGAFGGAGGGCRMWPYPSDAEALRDALRLSRAMSFKLALAGVPSGGAKAVVMGDPATDKTEALLGALGRAVQRLGGRFVMGEDVGTTADDMQVVRRETPYVMTSHEGTAAYTAQGVFLGLQAAVEHQLGRRDLEGVRVAVQGLGHVGASLARLLSNAGAVLTVTDVSGSACAKVGDETGARVVAPDAIYDVEAEVFAPCALGAVLNDATIPRLHCRVIAGAANNQLDRDDHAERLAEHGILYAPDFVLNAGGVIAARDSLSATALGSKDAVAALAPIRETLETVLGRAEREGISPHRAAMELAREALAAQQV